MKNKKKNGITNHYDSCFAIFNTIYQSNRKTPLETVQIIFTYEESLRY